MAGKPFFTLKLDGFLATAPILAIITFIQILCLQLQAVWIKRINGRRGEIGQSSLTCYFDSPSRKENALLEAW